MKLTELNPRWIGDKTGISFDCPCCRTQRLVVTFPKWTRDGDNFDTLTISPSVDASATGHWHGFIQGGQIK